MPGDVQDLTLDQIIVAMTPFADQGLIRQVIFTSRLLPVPNEAVAVAWRQFAEQCQQQNLLEFRDASLIEAARLTPTAPESAAWLVGQPCLLNFSDIGSTDVAGLIRDHGFIRVSGVLESAEIDEVIRLAHRREPMAGEWRPENGANAFHEIPEARFMAIHPKVRQVLTAIFRTEPILLVEQASLARGLRTHWHTDTVRLPNHGRTYGDPDDLILTVLIYPQRSDSFFGGGLDVYPGSHKSPEHKEPEGPFFPAVSRPGDILVFDARLWHRGGPAPVSDPDRPPKILMGETWAKNEHCGAVWRRWYRDEGDVPFMRALQEPMDPAFLHFLDEHQVRWI